MPRRPIAVRCPGTPTFLRSIPRETALGEAFVAYEMNGQPLPSCMAAHCASSCRDGMAMGVDEVAYARARPHDRVGQSLRRAATAGADGSPVDPMRVKSLITAPLDGEGANVGITRVTGVTDGHWDDRAGRDLGDEWSDRAAGTLHERAAMCLPAPMETDCHPVGRRAARALARPTRPGTPSPSMLSEPGRGAGETTLSMRCVLNARG